MARPQPFNNTILNDTELNARTVDVIGDLDTLDIARFRGYNSNLVQIINKIMQFDYIFYVDAVNGNDNNDGSNTAPLKTIDTALIKTVRSATNLIILENGQTHTLSTWNIDLFNKYVHFASRLATSTNGAPDSNSPVFHIPDDGVNLKTSIRLINSSVAFSGWRYPVKIKIGSSNNTVGRVAFDGHMSANGADGSRIWSSLTFAHTEVQANCWVSSNVPFITARVTTFKKNYGDNIFFGVGYGTLNFSSSNSTYIDQNGNTINNYSSLFHNLIKDANGVPRNVLTNLIL